MQTTLLSIFLVWAFVSPITTYGQTASSKVYKPKKIKLKGHQPDYEVVVDSGYDPNLLIPHFDEKSQKWGYIHRTRKSLVVPHVFDNVGFIYQGYALALNLNEHFGIDTYWIGHSGKVKLLDADTVSQAQRKDYKYFQTKRFDDGHFFVARGSHIKTFAADGSIELDTVLNGSGRFFQYFGNGNVLIEFQDAMLFWDNEDQKAIRFDTTSYFFPKQASYERGSSESFKFCDIQRRSDGKIGLIDRHGQLVVDFEWEAAKTNTSLQAEPDSDERLYPYFPNEDSIFLAYKNDVAYYVHVNGKIIFEFPANTIAFSPQYAFWPEQKLFQMYVLLPGNKFINQLIDPVSKEVKLTSYDAYIYLDQNRLMALSINTNPKIAFDFAYTFHSAPTFEQIEIPHLASHFRPIQTFYYDHQYYWVIKNFYTNKFGLMTEDGDFVFLPTLSYLGLYGSSYHVKYPSIVMEKAENDPTNYEADPKGNIFTGSGSFYDHATDKAKEYRFSGEPWPAPKPLQYFHAIRANNDFYPNILIFVSQYNKKGKKIGSGIIDFYGQVYF